MLSSLSMNSMAKMPDMPEPIGRPSVWRNMRPLFKGVVLVVEHHIESVCDVLSGEMVYCVLDPVDSVVDGFLDRYGCVKGYDIQATRVW